MSVTNDLLVTLFDHSFTLTTVLDREFKISYFNPQFASFTKLPPRKIIGSSIEALIPLEKNMWSDLFTIASEKGVGVSPEVDFEYQNAQYSFVFKVARLDSEKFLLFGNDLSVEKSLHNKYRDQVELLREDHKQVILADKVRTIGELTAGISHEINNPLTVASGNTEVLGFLLEGDEQLDLQKDEIGQCVGNISEALERIASIIMGMKQFLHQGDESLIGSKKQYLKLEDVIVNAIKLTEATFESVGVTLVSASGFEGAVVLGDQTKLEQVLINLLQNALDSVKSLGKEGKVSISLEKNIPDQQIYLHVEDNGSGIDALNRDKIFDTFFTTKDVGEGTGLGLPICQKIAQDHQGELECLESPGGAHFRLSLPMIEVSSYASNEEILSKINDIDGKKVLVVDNDVTILNLCQKFLEGTKYIFIGSTGGEQALDVLTKYDIDMVITDLQMPAVGGRDFAKELRKKGMNIPLYYSSSSKGVELYNEDKAELSLSGMLIKPYKREELISLIENALSSSKEP